MIGWKQIMALILVIILETGAVTMLREGVDKHGYIVGGILLYIFVAIVFYYILSLGAGVAVTNGLWNAGSIVTISLVGIIMFHEHLQWNHYLGLGLGVFSVVLLMFGNLEDEHNFPI